MRPGRQRVCLLVGFGNTLADRTALRSFGGSDVFSLCGYVLNH